MAFYHDPRESHHAGAVVAARIESGGCAAQHRAGDEAGHAIEQRHLEFAAQAIGDQPGDTLHGLERHVAGETIGDDDIDVAREDVITLHETDVIETARAEQAVRPLHHFVPLDVLFTDVEQADAWSRYAIDVPGDDGTHGGELP